MRNPLKSPMTMIRKVACHGGTPISMIILKFWTNSLKAFSTSSFCFEAHKL